MNLSVKIGKMKLRNPVMAASGTFGPEYGELADVSKFGAVIAKTVTLRPRVGNPPPRIVETASGMLNSIGLENNGVKDFIKNKLPLYRKLEAPLIASVAGDSAAEYSQLVNILKGVKGISAIELNLSCPNVKHPNREFLIAQDADAVHEVVSAARSAAKGVPAVHGTVLIAKLSPNVTDIAGIALACQEAGADAVSLVNTFPGMAVDIETKMPKLGYTTGGLSGPAIKPLAVRMVHEVYKKAKIPVIGMGGIMDYKDAVEFILAGATAVQVGTANFVEPDAAAGIVTGLGKYMKANGIKDVNTLIGGMKR